MINIPITIHKNSLLLINKTRNIWKTPLLNKNVVGKYRVSIPFFNRMERKHSIGIVLRIE